MNWTEILGTAASVVVALSLTLKNMKGLRYVNTIGAVFFSFYGFLIGSWPVLGLNAFIAGINVYYLHRMAGETAHFQILPLSEAPGLLKAFISFYLADIRRFHPGFSLPADGKNLRGAFILREAVPIGLVVFISAGPETWEILADYAVPSYRDRKNARFFYSQGYKTLFPGEKPQFLARVSLQAVSSYLKKLGFKEVSGSAGDPIFTFRPEA